jgi:MSHA biogenesis protein MshQ
MKLIIKLKFLILLLLFISSNNINAAISYVDSVTDSDNDERGSLTVPVATEAGDVLITQVVIRNRNGSDSVSAETGWNLIATQDQDSDVFQSLYYKVAVAGDAGSSYEWDFDGNGGRRYILGMSVFRGVDNDDPIAAENSSTNGVSSGDLVAPSITTINSNSYLFAAYALEAGNQSFTAPTGMSENYDVETGGNNNGLTAMSARELFSSISATGNRTAGVSTNSDDGIAHLIALNEDSSVELDNVITNCSNLSTLSLQFSEQVNTTTAENINNYSLVSASSNSISITAASLSFDTVTLTLANDMNDLTAYTVTVNNVEDLDGNSIESNSSDSFTLSCEINCITDNFVGPGDLSDSWSVGNSSGSFGDPTIITDGRLRLTDASSDVSTFATLLNQFPGSENRIEIEFDYYGYAGGGADGISVNFSDASISPQAGAFGGSLGYAQKTGIDGFAGGWLGVGLDEYGNFSTNGEGRDGGGSSRITDSVALRGSGSGTTGYPYLTGTSSLSPGIDLGGSNPEPGHRYKIVIDNTLGGGVATVIVQRDTTGSGSSYETVISEFNIFDANSNQDSVPDNWVVSFTGSTGGSTNIHEIGDLKVCAAQPIETFVIVDHYDISHTGTGLTCEGSEVTITAHDINHDPVNVISDTSIAVTTTPAVTGIISSPVTILAGTSSTSFYLQQTSALADIDIDLTDGSFTDSEGTSEDPRISFLDTAFRFYADDSNTDAIPINTQISGKQTLLAPDNQDLALRAIRTNTDTGACEVGLVGSQTVSFAYTCINPSSCSTSELSVSAGETKNISGTDDGSGLLYTDLDMVFDANGSAAFNFNFPDAGQIQLHANLNVSESLPDPAFTLTGSSNEFVVRPFAFDLGFSGDYTAESSAGDRFIPAGEDFEMSVRAVNWSADDDTNNDGIVDDDADVTNNSATINFGQEITSPQALSITHTLKLPLPGNDGSLTSSVISTSASAGFFTAGITDGSPAVNLSWDEVGIIDIDVSLEDYLSASGANISGQTNNVGRFYPDYFLISVSNVTNSCGVFSYMDQPDIAIDYTLQAHKKNGGLTENYTSDFAKATMTLVAENDNDGGGYQGRFDDFDVGTWSNGEHVYTDSGNFTRDLLNLPDGPYSSLQVGIMLDDNDGDVSNILASNLDMKASTDTDCTVVDDCDAQFIGELDVRFGQLKLNNVFGPEVSDLDMNLQTEYFDGTSFVLSTDDSCTSLLDTDPPLTADSTSYTDNLTDGDTTPVLNSNITSGLGVIQFSGAGLGNEGSVIYSYDTNTYLPWLNTENDNDGDYADNPFGKVTFGQFRGTDRVIYWREIVR